MKNKKVRMLTQSAIMIALALVLSMLKIYHNPIGGGSVTVASMAPIVIISLMYPTKWGLFTSFVYSLIQMVEGFYPPPVQTFGNYVLLVLLDYVIAFGVLGLAGAIARGFGEKKRVLGAVVASVSVVFLRFFCHFLSGVIIWGIYAPEGTSPWIYSLMVNGPIMIGEMITTAIAVGVIVKVLDLKKFAAR